VLHRLSRIKGQSPALSIVNHRGKCIATDELEVQVTVSQAVRAPQILE
jgi:hypothetical protein